MRLSEDFGAQGVTPSFINRCALPIEVTNGTLEGDIVPGPITLYRLQSTSDNILRAYIAQGEVLPVATRSFSGIGIFAIPKGGRAKNCSRNFF